MTNEIRPYSPFNQKELKAKVTLLNFLIIMKWLKDKGIVKKNGKFPMKLHRHEGRSSYQYYFGIALGKYLASEIPGKWKKQRDSLDFKTLAPFQKLSYNYLDPNSLQSKLTLKELRNDLYEYDVTHNNQRLQLRQSGSGRYWYYTYNPQVNQNYSPIEFSEFQANAIPVSTPGEMDSLVDSNVTGILNEINSKFSAERNAIQYESNFIAAASVQEAIDECLVVGQSPDEARQLLIDKAIELRANSEGLDIEGLFGLAKMFLTGNEAVQAIELNDVITEIAA